MSVHELTKLDECSFQSEVSFVKRIITLEIAGAKYKLSSDADEEHLRHLADVINSRIQLLGDKAIRSAPAAQLLAIVALGLAEDLEEEKMQRMNLETKTRRTIQDVIERIDQKIQTQPVSVEKE